MVLRHRARIARPGAACGPSPAAVVHLEVQGHELGGSEWRRDREEAGGGHPLAQPRLPAPPAGTGPGARPPPPRPLRRVLPGLRGLPAGPGAPPLRGEAELAALYPGRRLRAALAPGGGPNPAGKAARGGPGPALTLLLPVVALQVMPERAGLGARVVAVWT